MQTFLPYADFEESAEVLDRQRLNKQIVECRQILTAIDRLRRIQRCGDWRDAKTGYIFAHRAVPWGHHPAVRMWADHEAWLRRYTNAMVQEWWRRGYTTHAEVEEWGVSKLSPPWWLGHYEFHVAHRGNLLRKKYNHYILHFDAPLINGYLWPGTVRGDFTDKRVFLS